MVFHHKLVTGRPDGPNGEGKRDFPRDIGETGSMRGGGGHVFDPNGEIWVRENGRGLRWVRAFRISMVQGQSLRM